MSVLPLWACNVTVTCGDQVALGLVSMMLRCVIVKTVELVDLIEMRKTDCFGKTRLVPHIPSLS